MTKDFFLKQLNTIIEDYEALVRQAKYEDLSDVLHSKVENLTTLITRAKATVQRITGINSEYYKDISNALAGIRDHFGIKLQQIIGTIRALKSDLENDYLKSLHDIIQSEIFSDYLEMASYLINEGFKDAAGVIIGSTLEVHLRELCNKNCIDIETTNIKGKIISKKADTMNSDLAKAGIYSLGYQKQITAWLDIRNSAAHGNYNDYSNEQIKLMLEGVRQFILATT